MYYVLCILFIFVELQDTTMNILRNMEATITILKESKEGKESKETKNVKKCKI